MKDNENSTVISGMGISTSDGKQAAGIHDIDQLVVNAFPDIGNSRVTSVAQQVLNYDPEALVWQDSPSLTLMLSTVFKWIVIFIAWLVVLSYLSPAKSSLAPATPIEASAEAGKTAKAAPETAAKKKKLKQAEDAKVKAAKAQEEIDKKKRSDDEAIRFLVLAFGVLVFFIQILRMIGRACRLSCIKYSMSSQRLKIESGVFSKASNTYELHTLDNAQIYTPFFMKFFGRSNLYVSGLWLIGIKNAEAVRDLLRNAGQIEASRVDKARFR